MTCDKLVYMIDEKTKDTTNIYKNTCHAALESIVKGSREQTQATESNPNRVKNAAKASEKSNAAENATADVVKGSSESAKESKMGKATAGSTESDIENAAIAQKGEGRLPKACIFDFDGVIVDSEKYHHAGWKRVADELGVPFDYEEYCPMKSAGRRVVIPYLLAKANQVATEERFAELNRLREESMKVEILKLNRSDVLPGVEEFILRLKKLGIKLAVASASVNSGNVAKRFDLRGYFDEFVDGNDGLPHKPQPDVYLHVANLLGVRPCECVVFEDSINGIKAAKGAKMRCIGVQAHFTDLPDRIIDSFENIDESILIFDEEDACACSGKENE